MRPTHALTSEAVEARTGPPETVEPAQPTQTVALGVTPGRGNWVSLFAD